MSWDTVDKPESKQSLNSWMLDNGYRQAVIDSVSAGTCKKILVERIKSERKGAKGPGGSLSRAQKQSLFGAPPKASLLAAPTPAPKKRKKGAVRFQPEDSELLALNKHVKELEGKLADAGAATPDAVDDAMSDGPEKPSGGRLCFVCGDSGHLKAACPKAEELRKQEAWIKILQEGPCMLEDTARAAMLAQARCQRDMFQSGLTLAKEKAIPPEQQLMAKRATVTKCSAALSSARSALERHELKLREMHEENDQLRESLDAATLALKSAETDLEAAKERLFTLPAPAVTPPPLVSELEMRREAATLREALRRAEAERDEARAASAFARLPSATPRGRGLADASQATLEELEAELRRAQDAFKHALMAGFAESNDPSRITILLEVTEQVAAKRLLDCTLKGVPDTPLTTTHNDSRQHPH